MKKPSVPKSPKAKALPSKSKRLLNLEEGIQKLKELTKPKAVTTKAKSVSFFDHFDLGNIENEVGQNTKVQKELDNNLNVLSQLSSR